MPTLGRPKFLNESNPYRNIRKHQEMNKGDFLNKISGFKETAGNGKIKIVDGAQHGKLGKEGFMRLLMHQLSNQDPIKPIDQNKMAADLARLSQLEQMSNMNKNLKKALADDMIKKKFFAASFLGKMITTKGATIKHLGDGNSPTINFKVSQDIEKGFVRIFDQRKQMIAQFDLKARPAGIHSIPWNGNQLDGMGAAAGIYYFQVMAWDKNNNKIAVETRAEGLVTGVSFDQQGEAILSVDGKKVYLRDVEKFRLRDMETQQKLKKSAEYRSHHPMINRYLVDRNKH
ncbi:MAG: hypothetical protein OXB88_09005 [Bacteriovoracales bacterium]|nr:hypothetical protein [Bacteriovoracales bacterium]